MMTKEFLLDGVEEKYHEMLRQVDIANFTKAISLFSGLNLKELSDNIVKNYLVTWAQNKYRFWIMLDKQLIKNKKVIFNKDMSEMQEEILEFQKQFPGYSLWLQEIIDCGWETNKVDNIGYSNRRLLRSLFPSTNVEGSSVTHFFKKYLDAPDELVNLLAKMYDSPTKESAFAISIDPVDMMLASENPYDWTSCYRLETDNDSSHADGCLAMVLDTTSLITYIWTSQGKMKLYDTFEFKDVHFKHKRQSIAISQDFKKVHFNAIYPTKDDSSSDLAKKCRAEVEALLSEYLQVENKWKSNCINNGNFVSIDRKYSYGYSEFSYDNIYRLSDLEENEINSHIEVYDVPIVCPCGCGELLPGSDEDDDCEIQYQGGGFRHDNFEHRYYCECSGEYCDYEEGSDECVDCPYWRRSHPICPITEEECENSDSWEITVRVVDGRVETCHECCCNCPHWQECHEEEEEEE